MKSEKISELTTNRLSVYLRCLNTLAAAGIKTVSSQALPDQFNLNSAQIRKDLAYFDNDREKIGRRLGQAGVTVHDVKRVERVVREEGIDVAVIAVPAREAQKVLNQLTAAGVKAVLNFAPARLRARLGVKLKTVDLTISLESLSYFLASPQTSSVTNPPGVRAYEE